jgi:hypothetical protein
MKARRIECHENNSQEDGKIKEQPGRNYQKLAARKRSAMERTAPRMHWLGKKLQYHEDTSQGENTGEH